MPPARMCGLAATGSLVSCVLLPRRPPHRLSAFCLTRGISMPRIVRCGVIQTHCEWSPEKHSLADIKEKMIAKHERLIADAAKKKVQILGLQERSEEHTSELQSRLHLVCRLLLEKK